MSSLRKIAAEIIVLQGAIQVARKYVSTAELMTYISSTLVAPTFSLVIHDIQVEILDFQLKLTSRYLCDYQLL